MLRPSPNHGTQRLPNDDDDDDDYLITLVVVHGYSKITMFHKPIIQNEYGCSLAPVH